MKKWALLFCLVFYGCSSSPVVKPAIATDATPATEKWKMLFDEKFDHGIGTDSTWKNELYTETDRYSDNGEYFKTKFKNFKPPEAYRISAKFGTENWLQVELYTQSKLDQPSQLLHPDLDPKDSTHSVLALESPRHSNGVIIRSSNPLPAEYRVCSRVGFADFGGSLAKNHNGYIGTESAGPWVEGTAVNENGLYWLAILDTEPKPRNNVYIHHHRKVVIDSDNNDYGPNASWTWIFNGHEFLRSGEHPVMMFALDNENLNRVWDYERTGQPFISYSADGWNAEAEVKQIRAVDAYLENEWYTSCITKFGGEYLLSIEGRFKYGGLRKYQAGIALEKVYHAYGSPDFFMLGDPHVNYYRGRMLLDRLTLEVPELVQAPK